MLIIVAHRQHILTIICLLLILINLIFIVVEVAGGTVGAASPWVHLVEGRSEDALIEASQQGLVQPNKRVCKIAYLTFEYFKHKFISRITTEIDCFNYLEKRHLE